MQAARFSGGPHNHPEKFEKVLLDFAKDQLKQQVIEKEEWKEKTCRQIYNDFLNSFADGLDERKKSLFLIIFPPFSSMEPSMARWVRFAKTAQMEESVADEKDL